MNDACLSTGPEPCAARPAQRPARKDDELPQRAAGSVETIFGSPKIFHHPDRLSPYVRRWGTAGEPARDVLPVTMEFDLTNVCSHACPLCVGRRAPESAGEGLFAVEGDGEQIPTERALDYIRQMAGAGVRGIIFTGGGEPTVHRDLVPLVVQAARLGIDVGLITHGGLLHRHDVDALVASCAWIRVSVDAASAADFQRVHGRGVAEWTQVWRNIERLVSARRSLAARSGARLATLGVAFLTGPENATGIISFARRARDCGVDYAQLRPFHRHVDFDATPYLEQARTLCDAPAFKVLGSLHKYGLISEGGRLAPRSYSYCHIAHLASVICANEKMYVCCHLRNQGRFCIGDLRRDTFREILSDPRTAALVRQVDVNGCLPGCRGDHVNRQIQQILDGESMERPRGAVPAHVNFL